MFEPWEFLRFGLRSGRMRARWKELTLRPQGLKRSPLGLYWVVSYLVCVYDDIIHNECISGQMAASHIFETSCNQFCWCSHVFLLFI